MNQSELFHDGDMKAQRTCSTVSALDPSASLRKRSAIIQGI